MAYLGQQLTNYSDFVQLREKRSDERWLFKTTKKPAPHALLEEEIHNLRCRLEEMVFDGAAMTSDTVIELSKILDSKINDYMKIVKKSR
ncbi:aspartyl-phosphate phosphatase Spo0E family protein [Paenibacillus eucommiae]|uniref:Aspartyl-phosphate phosphatase Spo0E family protein n=1 Tax=Paenibacillus eucommiae TaxID=1355755 RepID=A0ABS4J3X7_9BACL|nr:aspartyl-phosphate phosphatase Spo0E family protein [Paenibacillus eucommiae]MBP1993509.1 hypothetical protein [Paenibacillus eucommiae]